MPEGWTEADDAVNEVREIRHGISAQFDHDPKKMIEHYVELDKHYTGPVVALPPRKKGKPGA